MCKALKCELREAILLADSQASQGEDGGAEVVFGVKSQVALENDHLL